MRLWQELTFIHKPPGGGTPNHINRLKAELQTTAEATFRSLRRRPETMKKRRALYRRLSNLRRAS